MYQLAFFAAVADTGVAVGTIVALGSAPTLTGLFEWIVDAPPAPATAGSPATALACAGVALLALAGGDADVSAPGVALAVVAGGAYASYTLAAKRLLAARARAGVGDGRRVRARRARAAARAARHQRTRLARTPTGSRSPCSSASCRPRSPTCCSPAACGG